jgi:hypothetical protein
MMAAALRVEISIIERRPCQRFDGRLAQPDLPCGRADSPSPGIT